MKKLLSLPPNVVSCFYDITNNSPTEYFCTSDPINCKLGSGGGTAWLLESCHQAEQPDNDFYNWLSAEKRILLHAGGQSRRLPAYAPSGKILTPIPVFRWARGQKINQTLLDLQLPLYEAIMQKAPGSVRTLIASGDVYLRATEPLQDIPEADVICYGLWADSELASHHGVFMMNRENPTELDFMLQKPSTQEQAQYMPTHFVLMDIGIWLLSDRAVKALMKKCEANGDSQPFAYYDLYSQFGQALGLHPSTPDKELEGLSVAILPLPGGEFYHYGTAPEMISSSEAIQNLVKDQRLIIQQKVKQQPSIFTQNSIISNTSEMTKNIWVENAYLGEGWHFHSHNIITGVPKNNWEISLPDGICVDIVPIGEKSYAVRPYGYHDAFRGDLSDSSTTFLNQPVSEWLAIREISMQCLERTDDLQASHIFPVVDTIEETGKWLAWMISPNPDKSLSKEWCELRRISADEISNTANLRRLFQQRNELRNENLPTLARNWRKSVFYQADLKDMAQKFAQNELSLPEKLSEDASTMLQIHDAMFRSEVHLLRHEAAGGEQAAQAFSLLRKSLTENARTHKCSPHMTTYQDQIVWGRSSVRIDVAGGWTDTPPYSLMSGGNVVNLAIELNGQPPLQVYVKPCKEPVVICRSIDLGAIERIETYEELKQYNKVGSPFSIPKAALALAGFCSEFGAENYRSLKEQLQAFGCGIEITLLAAIPAGSGLGTSSILAATVLGAVSDFCGLGWDKSEICNRTLILEQLLTTGGGWQDQYGGVLPGIKLLQTTPGFNQSATTRWLPDTLFTNSEYSACHLLYYTGVTRTAKHILTEIVRGMFLNSSRHLSLLDEMKQHALTMFDAIQRSDFELYGKLLRATWQQNKALDAGTNPDLIESICQKIDDLCLGYKLPGAGGGGYMYMVAKDEEAARRIKKMLAAEPASPNARFVEMSLSQKGLQISRS